MNGAESGRETAERSPVFVDASGRRRRGVTVLGYLGASACTAYLAAFGITVSTHAGVIDAAGVALAPSPSIDEEGGDEFDAVPADVVVPAATPRRHRRRGHHAHVAEERIAARVGSRRAPRRRSARRDPDPPRVGTAGARPGRPRTCLGRWRSRARDLPATRDPARRQRAGDPPVHARHVTDHRWLGRELFVGRRGPDDGHRDVGEQRDGDGRRQPRHRDRHRHRTTGTDTTTGTTTPTGSGGTTPAVLDIGLLTTSIGV